MKYQYCNIYITINEVSGDSCTATKPEEKHHHLVLKFLYFNS